MKELNPELNDAIKLGNTGKIQDLIKNLDPEEIQVKIQYAETISLVSWATELQRSQLYADKAAKLMKEFLCHKLLTLLTNPKMTPSPAQINLAKEYRKPIQQILLGPQSQIKWLQQALDNTCHLHQVLQPETLSLEWIKLTLFGRANPLIDQLNNKLGSLKTIEMQETHQSITSKA
jgi:hypothetical protein